jgi:DNA topoisomerase-1
MENELDKIAEGKIEWAPIIKNFYEPFEKNLEQKYQEIEKRKVVDEKTDEICEKCGSPMIIKTGRFGKFMACSNFPKCKNTKHIENSTNVDCPECKQGKILERKTRKGKIFFSCSRYPECKFALWDKPTGEKCPKCNSLLVQTRDRKIKCSNKECNFAKE